MTAHFDTLEQIITQAELPDYAQAKLAKAKRQLTPMVETLLKGDKGTQRHTAQDFETIEGTKNREPQSSSPNQYVP